MDLFERFPGEKECLDNFTWLKSGITFLKSGLTSHKWMPVPNQLECKRCDNQINVKSGTLMENSKLPIKHWFVAIQLLTSETEKYTISEIQEKLSGAEPEQINRMLVNLNSCLDKPENGKSFDQLLLACIVNHNHPPAIAKINQNNN